MSKTKNPVILTLTEENIQELQDKLADISERYADSYGEVENLEIRFYKDGTRKAVGEYIAEEPIEEEV